MSLQALLRDIYGTNPGSGLDSSLDTLLDLLLIADKYNVCSTLQRCAQWLNGHSSCSKHMLKERLLADYPTRGEPGLRTS